MVGAKQYAIGRKIFEEKEPNPIVKNMIMPTSMKGHEDESKSFAGSFLDRFNKKKEITPKKKESEREEISEEVMNQITYHVFQNIKKYLDNDFESCSMMNHIGHKRIKLEIDL